MPVPLSSQCHQGDAALRDGEWERALEVFQSAIAKQETPECLEGLGHAAWWLDRADLVFDSRERAFRLYRDQKNHCSAARIAVWLAWDYLAFRGESAVANGWLRRARRLLQDQEPCYEGAFLELREAVFCLLEHGDATRSLAHALEGARIAQEAGIHDLETLALAVQGLARVTLGEVEAGMGCLDEANASIIAGELSDRVAIGLTSCYLVSACEQVRDYDRAMQWCKRLKGFSLEWGLRPLVAVCRTHYATICIWRGTWQEAEAELCSAREELMASRPAMAADAALRLGELRHKQGRLEEATALFQSLAPAGSAQLGQAAIALDDNDPRTAVDKVERYLRQLPVTSRLQRAPALELLVRGLVDLGETAQAATAAQELQEIASLTGTAPLHAAAGIALGYIALASHAFEQARRHFEDALDGYTQAGAPFEQAHARVLLAKALHGAGQVEAASEQAALAAAGFSELRADLEAQRARGLLSAWLDHVGPEKLTLPASVPDLLTGREVEVLRLVAEGLSNRLIAERLFLSEHTVHRHLANILNKLDVNSRAAAISQATRLRLLN